MALLPTVLVVDDDAQVRELVRAALGEECYRVLTAAEGREALRLLEHQHPDVILLNFQLSDLDGPSFAQAYHAMPGPHAPLLVLSEILPITSKWWSHPPPLLVLPTPVDLATLSLLLRAIGRAQHWETLGNGFVPPEGARGR